MPCYYFCITTSENPVKTPIVVLGLKDGDKVKAVFDRVGTRDTSVTNIT